MKPILLSCFLLFSLTTAFAGSGDLPISFSVFSNGTALPGQSYAGLVSKTLHPGFSLGLTHQYKQKKHSALFQNFKLGYFYHQHAQSGIQIYTETGYRLQSSIGLYADGLLGVGYLHSLPDIQRFTWTEKGYVRQKGIGRAQVMATASIAAGYALQSGPPLRFFMQYQFWIQAPFVRKYVPVLPNTAFHIGTIYSLKKK